ncbi:MAG: DNA-3-methyladenine glycosylase I, partial [bacterium]|nr:DNA-3-methyladenine glycosylase I [bacterium]
MPEPARCPWGTGDQLMVAYHDREWGVPVRDDRLLFELLILEGAQAGLSWRTVLHRREGYRRAFDGFDTERVAAFDDRRVAALLQDPGIIRNRQKVDAAVANARATLGVQDEHGSLAGYLWSFVAGAPVQNAWQGLGDVPANDGVSTAMSRDLRRRGFRFAGPTICYALMQSAGLVNDHVVGCFRHQEVR